jgi:hypothetical protein
VFCLVVSVGRAVQFRANERAVPAGDLERLANGAVVVKLERFAMFLQAYMA